MAQYWRDFQTAEDVVDQPPPGFTPRLMTSGVTWTVKEEGGLKFVRRLSTSTGDSLLALDDAGQPSTFEILGRCRMMDTTPTGLQTGVGGRADGPGGASDGSWIMSRLDWNSTESHGRKRFERRQSVADGGSGSVAQWSTFLEHAAQTNANEWVWVLLRVGNLGAGGEAQDARAKIWLGDIGDEPVDWDRISASGAEGLPAGHLGLWARQSTSVGQDWALISIGTFGDEAPREFVEPPGDTQISRPASVEPTGGWMRQDLMQFAMETSIDDEEDETTYIRSSGDPQADECQVNYGGLATPSGQRLVHYAIGSGGTNAVNLTVRFGSGTTVHHTRQYASVGEGPIVDVIEITAADVDWADTWLRPEADTA